MKLQENVQYRNDGFSDLGEKEQKMEELKLLILFFPGKKKVI